eukprot:5071678-Pyramimonas_sp.AAC.1
MGLSRFLMSFWTSSPATTRIPAQFPAQGNPVATRCDKHNFATHYKRIIFSLRHMRNKLFGLCHKRICSGIRPTRDPSEIRHIKNSVKADAS